MSVDMLTEIHLFRSNELSIDLDSTGTGEDGLLSEVLLFTSFTVSAFRSSWLHEYTDDLLGYLSIATSEVKTYHDDIAPFSMTRVPFSGKRGHRRFLFYLTMGHFGCDFRLKSRGFGILKRDRDRALFAATSCLYDYLLERHASDREFREMLIRAAGVCADSYLSGAIFSEDLCRHVWHLELEVLGETRGGGDLPFYCAPYLEHPLKH